MNANQKAEKELLSLPGDTILETIEYLKLSQTDLASRMGLTPEKVSDIIKAKEPISVKTAFLLERVLNIDASFWLNLEKSYREKLYRIEQYQYLDDCLLWLKQIPVNFLKKNNYINAALKGNELVQQVLQFFRVASPKQWQEIYVHKYANANYKKSTVHNSTLGSMATWIRLGEIEVEKNKATKYDKATFLQVLEEAKNLVAKNDKNFPQTLKALCAKAGVQLVYTPKIPKAPVSGATRWIGGNPVIQLTDRHTTNDHFWFSFFHEAGHILKHGKTEIFIEDFEGFNYDAAKENEANAFAQKMLLSPQAIDELNGIYTDVKIKAIAKKHNTHAAIIVGRLQHSQAITYAQLNYLKEKVILFAN